MAQPTIKAAAIDVDGVLTASSLTALSDVTITTPAEGNLLSYQSGDWVNSDTMTGNLIFSAGQLRADIGTVSLPGIAFEGDTNTGIYQPSTGADEIRFATAGTNRLAIESNGTLNVAGTTDYEALVTTDDDIPNKKFIDTGLALKQNDVRNVGSLELYQNGTGDRNAFIDFHSSDDAGQSDHSARLIRDPGVNGGLNLQNKGTGSVTIRASAKTFTFATTGVLTLPNDPIGASDAVTKSYVDFRGALAEKSANQNVTANTWALVTFTAEDYDTDAIHSTSTNTGRLTVPTGVTKVRLTGQIAWEANATGQRYISLRRNNSTSFAGGASNWATTIAANARYQQVVSPVISCVAGQYFEVWVYQTSGSTIAITSDAFGSLTWFGMEIIQ